MQNHCPNRSVLGILNKDGVFAKYITLPTKNLYVLPDSVSDEEAVFVEPLAAAFEIIQQVDIMPYSKVCVLGDGKLGLLVGQVLATKGCDLIVVGNHKEKLSILQRKGIKTALSSNFNGKEFDVVIDCTGSPYGVETAFKIIKPKGNELTIIGSRCGPFLLAINAIKTKKIDLHPLISKIFPLEEGIKALKYASRKGVLKVILKVQ